MKRTYLWFVAAAVLCWAIGIAAGLYLAVSPTACPGLATPPARPTAGAVFVANIKVLCGCFLGLATGAASSVVTLVLNGMYLGMQWNLFAARLSVPRRLALLAPHGILEIPGILIGGAVGMMGITILRSLCRDDVDDLRRHLRPMAVGIVLSVSLIFFGAVVESWFISRL
jgi:uncharacterized membrane protein SpoIIM required for sporulation